MFKDLPLKYHYTYQYEHHLCPYIGNALAKLDLHS